MLRFSILTLGFAQFVTLSSCLPAGELEQRAVNIKLPAQPTTTFEKIALTSQTASTTIPATTGVRVHRTSELRLQI